MGGWVCGWWDDEGEVERSWMMGVWRGCVG